MSSYADLIERLRAKSALADDHFRNAMSLARRVAVLEAERADMKRFIDRHFRMEHPR